MSKIKPTVTKKFRELLLYVAAQSADDPRFGAVKLNKILSTQTLVRTDYWGTP